MDKFDGDLMKLYKDKIIPENVSYDIFKQIVNSVTCLFNCDHLYMDLKLENILYRCEEEDKFIVILGDLGGVIGSRKKSVPDGMSHTFEYPKLKEVVLTDIPLHRLNENKIDFEAKISERDVVWLLGYLYLHILSFNDNDLIETNSNIKNLNTKILSLVKKKTQYIKEISEISEIYEEYNKLIKHISSDNKYMNFIHKCLTDEKYTLEKLKNDLSDSI